MSSRKKKEQVPLRLKVTTVLSGVILAAVCSLEIIEVPFENELWFCLLIIGILLGCLLMMWWSFGGFDKKDENHQQK